MGRPTPPDIADETRLGWNPEWAADLNAVCDVSAQDVGRIVAQERSLWGVGTLDGRDLLASASPGLPTLPVVGDWVALSPAEPDSGPVVTHVLPRRTALLRGSAGSRPGLQVLAANASHIWVVEALHPAPSSRRIERFLTAAWESGGAPGLVLTKSDLVDDLGEAVEEVTRSIVGVPIWVTGRGELASLDQLRDAIPPGDTVALVGPSGAGKSTLVNELAGEILSATGVVRDHDGKGRHTTTRRALFDVGGGRYLIDTPGIRELRLSGRADAVHQTYPDIVA